MFSLPVGRFRRNRRGRLGEPSLPAGENARVPDFLPFTFYFLPIPPEPFGLLRFNFIESHPYAVSNLQTPPASGQRNAGRWLAGARFLQVLNEGHFGMREGAWQG